MTSVKSAEIASHGLVHSRLRRNVLYLCDNNYASYPVWNIETDKSVMKGHSDLNNKDLRKFVVALIDDAIVHPDKMKSGRAQTVETVSTQGSENSLIDCFASDNYERLKTLDSKDAY